jgi:hypothetical protein
LRNGIHDEPPRAERCAHHTAVRSHVPAGCAGPTGGMPFERGLC